MRRGSFLFRRQRREEFFEVSEGGGGDGDPGVGAGVGNFDGRFEEGAGFAAALGLDFIVDGFEAHGAGPGLGVGGEIEFDVLGFEFEEVTEEAFEFIVLEVAVDLGGGIEDAAGGFLAGACALGVGAVPAGEADFDTGEKAFFEGLA